MNLISKIEELKNKISGQIQFEQSLSKYSWFNLGGPAKVIFNPKNISELSIFLKSIKGFSKIKVLGAGSNTLIRDGGFDGIILKLGKNFSHISLLNEDTLIAGSSLLDKNVSNFALQNSISGFEFLSCIPGTIGGGVRMNSGCYDEDISKIFPFSIINRPFSMGSLHKVRRARNFIFNTISKFKNKLLHDISGKHHQIVLVEIFLQNAHEICLKE